MTDDRTPLLGLPLPSPDNLLSEDVERLREALIKTEQAIDDAETLALALGD